MKENTEYLKLLIIIVNDTKFQQGQENNEYTSCSEKLVLKKALSK